MSTAIVLRARCDRQAAKGPGLYRESTFDDRGASTLPQDDEEPRSEWTTSKQANTRASVTVA